MGLMKQGFRSAFGATFDVDRVAGYCCRAHVDFYVFLRFLARIRRDSSFVFMRNIPHIFYAQTASVRQRDKWYEILRCTVVSILCSPTIVLQVRDPSFTLPVVVWLNLLKIVLLS